MSGETRTIIMGYQPWKLCGCRIRLRWLHWYSKDTNCDDSVLATRQSSKRWKWFHCPVGGEQLTGWITEVLGSNCTKGKIDVSIIWNVHLGSIAHPASNSRGTQKGVSPGAPWTVQVNNARNDSSLPQKSYGVVLNEAEALPTNNLQIRTGLKTHQTVG